MKKNVKYVSIFLISVSSLLGGCVQQEYKPTKTGLELQAIQSREFEAPYKPTFAATVSVFQDEGYIIETADVKTGLITASSPKSQRFIPFRGQVMRSRKATAFVETMPSGKVRVRLNFVNEEESSSGYGMKGASAIPIEDANIYQTTFEKIQKAIFIRTNT